MTAEADGPSWAGGRVRRWGSVLFGTRAGLALFLGALVWYGLFWRVGFFVSDTTTVANALVNLGEGRLALVETPYALTIGSQPGVVTVGGEVFGRNYGHALLALPVMWALEGLAALADPRLLVAGGWSLLVIGFSRQVAMLVKRPSVATVGAALALVAFAANVATATALPHEYLPLVALQVTTMLVAAILAVTVYRLVERFHGSRVGVVAGAAVVLATPLSFWASTPKRHVLTAAVAVVALYGFAVSRDSATRRSYAARMAAYVVVGLWTTVHPFEAFFLFVVLLPLDLLTAPANDRRTLLGLGGAFALSLLPFFLLNVFISGNPLLSPRLLGSGLESAVADGGGAAPGGSGTPGSGASGGTGGSTPLGLLAGTVGWIIETARVVVVVAWGYVGSGLRAALEPERLYHTVVRSGYMPGVVDAGSGYEPIDLTLLESFPLAAMLLWLPLAGLRRARERLKSPRRTLRPDPRGQRPVLTDPRRQTDLLAAGFAVVVVLVYLPKLPLQAQITVRYIVPIVPLVVYGLARSRFVRDVVETHPRWLLGGYLGTVLIGGCLVVIGFGLFDPAVGEAMQAHALLALAAVAVTVGSILTWPVHRDKRAVAVGLVLAAGLTTVFLLATGVAYFHYETPGMRTVGEPFALDFVRILAEGVHVG